MPEREPVGVCFSGGIDSGAVFLLTYHAMLRSGLNPSRLKAFTLCVDGEGSDLDQSRRFLEAVGLQLFHEPIDVPAEWIDSQEAVRVIEDYKPLDVQAGAMVLALCRGIRERYPQWRYLIDGDGGDENLKDYPIEENPELTIRSVLNNRMLYQEGWGVDRPRIAGLGGGRRTVIVECHPKLVGRRCAEFAEALGPALQVAMGLETVDPQVLPRLNKRMTLDDFARATEFLLAHGIEVRAFIMLRTPFQTEEGGVKWAMRSIDFAFSIGVECCSVIPARAGNGATERLQNQGHFHLPSPRSMETVVEYGAGLRRGRVFMDLWEMERFHTCRACGPARGRRLAEINLSQTVPPRINCSCDPLLSRSCTRTSRSSGPGSAEASRP